MPESNEYPETPTDSEGPKSDPGKEVGFAADLAGDDPPPKKPEEEKKPKEDAQTGDKKKPGWDLKRQHADETRAAQEREARMKTELSDTKNQLADMQAKLDAMEASKKAGDDIDLTEFEGVAQAVKELLGKIGGLETTVSRTLKEQSERLESIESTATSAKTTANKEAGQRALDNACKPLAQEYGAKYQNEAVEKTQAEYDDLGIVDLKPLARSKWVLKNLKSNFKELREADTAIDDDAGFDPPNIDSSGGGNAVDNRIPMQEGSLNDVAAQYQQNARKGRKR